ncbi:MAG TPA: class I SAM-dependent methyltransferase [Anaerolineales bacterium]
MTTNLPEAMYWGITELANDVAMQAMDNRASVEVDAVERGEPLDKVHGQALRDYEQFTQLISGAFSFLTKIGHSAGGISVDMGSGTGVGACILSKFITIKKVFAVEFSEHFVCKVMPLVFDKYQAECEKIQRVVSDFNHLEIKDGSIDIILDIDSFHHSEDLDFTLKECHRALGVEGVIIAIDRGWPNSCKQDELEAKLDVEFPDPLKKKYGIPLGKHFTRRDFGEHEYTIRQWFTYFKNNGFEPAVFRLWHPPTLNRIWLRLPTFDFSMALSSLLYRLGFRRLWAYGFTKARVMFVCKKVTR